MSRLAPPLAITPTSLPCVLPPSILGGAEQGTGLDKASRDERHAWSGTKPELALGRSRASAPTGRLCQHQARSKRSRFMTLFLRPPRSPARTSPPHRPDHRPRQSRGMPPVRTKNQIDTRARPPELVCLPIAPSYAPSGPAGCHCVRTSSRLTKKSFASVSGRWLKTPRSAVPPALAPSTRRPPTRNRHLGRGQSRELRLIHQCLLGHRTSSLPSELRKPSAAGSSAAKDSRRSAPATRPSAPA